MSFVKAWNGKETFTICEVGQDIESEDYVLVSKPDATIKACQVSNNRQVKFLPRHVSEKFPGLTTFSAIQCGLTILRDFYFMGMQTLERLFLSNNFIALIEPKAFKDLTSVVELSLKGNLIEILEGNHFSTMINLHYLLLSDNKIKVLSVDTFKIPDGKLNYVELQSNTCINGIYNMTMLESALQEKCTLEKAVENGFLTYFSNFVKCLNNSDLGGNC